VEGFALESAVVTHYRLKNQGDGNIVVDPAAKLEEELIIRPTSETIIWNTYKNWIQSYRDLPILINQWANVMRWEMRTRLFLRTSEFFWQEGHTAHATKEEAMEEAKLMQKEYANFMEGYIAVPVVRGVKSESERFAGAEETFTCEALMQDGKALQMGTSHFLGQNFAKAFDVKFQTKEGSMEHVWATSWGVSTRMVGALIMAHSDDAGLILPPKLAPIHVGMVPIYKTDEQLAQIKEKFEQIGGQLSNANITFKIDDDDSKRPGFKFAEFELKGIPVRLGLGPRDLENGTIEVARRDTKEKSSLPIDNVAAHIEGLLKEIQEGIYKKADDYRKANTTAVSNYDELKEVVEKGGFAVANWDGTTATEDKVKEDTKATIRCIPNEGGEADGDCVVSEQAGKHKVLYAKAY